MITSDATPAAFRPSWLFGVGATRTERALVFLAAGIGLAAWLWTARDHSWTGWQYAVGVVIVFDLAGGVVALGLNSSKRFYQGELPPPRTWPRRLMHSQVGFAAVHVQPIVLGLVFDAVWWWGPLWYVWALGGVVLVNRAPLRLARPLALFAVVAGVLTTTAIPAPPGFAWLPAVLLLKLVLAHAVHEEPYGTPATHRPSNESRPSTR